MTADLKQLGLVWADAEKIAKDGECCVGLMSQPG